MSELALKVSEKKAEVSRNTTVDSFVFEKLSITAPEEKSFGGGSGKYKEIPIKYNYGSVESKIIDELYLDGTELSSPTGISSSIQNQKELWSIYTPLNMKDEKVKKFHDFMAKFYAFCAAVVDHYKGQIGMPEFDKDKPSATGFKNPIFYPRDKSSGKIIEGRDPIMYFKLIKQGKVPFETKTLFTEIDITRALKWELLTNAEMKYVPLIHLEKIYIGGGKISLQIKIKSAIVTNLRGRNTTSTQTETAEAIKKDNPEIELSLKDQIAKLMLERQDSLIPTKVSSPQKEERKPEPFEMPKIENLDISSFLATSS